MKRFALLLIALTCLLPIEASACHLGSRLAEARPMRRMLRAAVAPFDVAARRVRGCRGGK